MDPGGTKTPKNVASKRGQYWHNKIITEASPNAEELFAHIKGAVGDGDIICKMRLKEGKGTAKIDNSINYVKSGGSLMFKMFEWHTVGKHYMRVVIFLKKLFMAVGI